jgi:hypothetical protein
MLEPSSPNTVPNQTQPPPQDVIDGEPEFEVSEIIDAKINNRRKKCKLLYLVRWTAMKELTKKPHDPHDQT